MNVNLLILWRKRYMHISTALGQQYTVNKSG